MLGEFELIAALRERIERAGGPPASERLLLGSGDDAAVIEDGGVSVVSVDALIEGVHFRRGLFPGRSTGHKALAAALSDLAAMGARPGEAYVQLGIPQDLDDAGCLELADGIAAVAAEHGVAIAGGDVTRAPVLMLAITVVGHAPSAADVVKRSGACPGDAVVLTGELGGAAAGLLLLERPELAVDLPGAEADALRDRQREPSPRLEAGTALAAAGATAMIDLSDGLGGDATHVAAASGATLKVDLASVPVQAGVAAVAAAAVLDPLDLVTAGGEDYELLATVPAARVEDARRAVAATGVALTVIGRVEGGEGVVQLSEPGGGLRPPSGYDQRRGRRVPGDPV